MAIKVSQMQQGAAVANSAAPAHKTDAPLGTPAVTFARALSTLVGDARNAQIQSMLMSIDEQGRRLGERVDITEFMRYRKLIKDFLADLVSNGYEFRRETAGGAKGRRRHIVTVATIDEALDALGKDILAGEADNLSVLASIGEIRGMLVDIFV